MLIVCALIALAVTAADQIVKLWIQGNIALGEVFFKIPHIAELVFVKNNGAAFSILSGKVWLLSAVSIIFCIAVVVYMVWKRPKNPLLCTSLALIFSGALGNAIDRIAYGYVVDFINLSFMNFPVFNIADIAITVGAVLIVVYEVFFDKNNG